MNTPTWLATIAGRVNEQMMNPFLTPDMINQMTENNIMHENSDFLTFNDVGVTPASMDKMAFDYMHRFRAGGHFQLVKGYH